MPAADTIPARLILRVLEEYDPNFKTCVARCLETGTVAPAEDFEEAYDLLMQTLRLEVLQAGRARQPLALFAKPAGPEFELRWQTLAAQNEPVEKVVTVIDTPVGDRKGVRSELIIRSVKKEVAS